MSPFHVRYIRTLCQLTHTLGNHVHGYEAVALCSVGDISCLCKYARYDVLPFQYLGAGFYQQQFACSASLEIDALWLVVAIVRTVGCGSVVQGMPAMVTF